MSAEPTLVETLQEALQAEYGALFVLPQHLARLEDEEMKRELKKIARDEMKHAEKTAQMLQQLSDEPFVDFPRDRPGSSLMEILEMHQRKEKEVIRIYKRAENLCQDAEMQKQLVELRCEEEVHLRTLQRLLNQL